MSEYGDIWEYGHGNPPEKEFFICDCGRGQAFCDAIDERFDHCNTCLTEIMEEKKEMVKSEMIENAHKMGWEVPE